LIDAGYVLAIASNQGGVSAGFKTLDQASSEMSYCLHLLESQDISIKTGLFCPDFDGNQCRVVNWGESFDYIADSLVGCKNEDLIGTFRKPSPGMLKAIASFFEMPKTKTKDANPFATELKIEDCWMIGDRDEDRLAAEAAGFSFLDAEEWRKGASPWII
jgi:D-glycero-D-manno-heptose 1,7-bisphosphate phosphatase